MELVVVSYPHISERDYDWIQAVRAEHDIYYEIIPPHFTFVFPCSTTDAVEFVGHIKQYTTGVKQIRFVSRCALVVKDLVSKYTYVFLCPDDGFSDIVRLHDRLYTGMLASQLRLDIPFIPHIGIGNALTPEVCKSLVDDLNRNNFSIKGTIDTLDIVSFHGKEIKTIERIQLEES